MPKGIDRLIINSPYEEPKSHWAYDHETASFELKKGRRKAGYLVSTPGAKSFNDPGRFMEIERVNQIRPRVREWREKGYPGVTGITKRLLDHWNDTEAREGKRFFFCQLEAIETLIWLAESSPAERQGIGIEGDGGSFERLCSKMATGSGKTIVMAMLITWQVLNKVTYPQDRRFSKSVFVVAPGLTVRSRLQVLVPSGPGNYYDEFNVVPHGLRDKLRRGKVRIRNWHVLNWEDEERIQKKKSVDKRGAKSDEAYVREVLGDMAAGRNLVVINDEAHHAWRVPPGTVVRGVAKAEKDQATKWIGGLDRIHKTRGILTCYDFSATPFVPLGRKTAEEWLFGWIVSDFGLNDAIESGLVKTPRVVVRDDGRLTENYKSRFYHIYMDDEVHDDLNRKAESDVALPVLVTTAYFHLGKDWREWAKKWEEAGYEAPPVMITVANRTETAARVYSAFKKGQIKIEELSDTDRMLHIDSKVLEKAEEQVEPIGLNGDESEGPDEVEAPRRKMTKQKQAEFLRRQVDTVGQAGKEGGKIQNVISVGMLSEGWDAKTVTHIMGLRAFSSQLLCEQVVGRGLRRTSYEVNGETGLFDPEYVNIFGVPFTFLPHEGGDDRPAPPTPPKQEVKPLPGRKEFEISWPNILRVDHVLKPRLKLDFSKVGAILLSTQETPLRATLSPILEGKTDLRQLTEIDLKELGKSIRLQTLAFEAARDVFDLLKPGWKGNREILLGQIIRLVEEFLPTDLIECHPPEFQKDELRRRVLIALNMRKVVEHICKGIQDDSTETLALVFDTEDPIRSTGDMFSWWTGKPNELTRRSHINRCVYDSTWEASEAHWLDDKENKNVVAWAKNDHLGFEILYGYRGVVRKYWPDFLIRLSNGTTLVLEVKGLDSEQNRAKRKALDEWVKAVNADGRFGRWAWDVSREPMDVGKILEKHIN